MRSVDAGQREGAEASLRASPGNGHRPLKLAKYYPDSRSEPSTTETDFQPDKVRDPAFLRGDNDRGWRADIDFVLQAASFTKLMEGSYERAANSRRPPTGDVATARRIIERRRAERTNEG